MYNLLYLFTLSLMLPFEYFKRPAKLRKRWLREKFGIFEGDLSSGNKKTIWIHAVSVGETIALSRLIRRLSENYPIVLSTITDTGQTVAKDRFRGLNVRVIYMPFDIPFVIRRTVKFFNPQILVIAETELWPNLIRVCSECIPVILVNGRLSEKSYRGYRRLKFFFRPILQTLKLICVQEKIYKDRFIALGASDDRIRVTGNMKFDLEIKRIDFPWENILTSPVILGGSTHEEEEELLLNAYLELKINGTLVLAPRHPERFDRVEKLVRDKLERIGEDIVFLRISEISKDIILKKQRTVILVDQMGILGSLYRICDIAVIGGSFIPHGGQNPLEPAYWSKPIICGKSMENFPFIEEFVKNDACIMTERERLKDALIVLIENHELRASMGKRANEIFLTKAGATERTLQAIEEIIL